MSDPNPYAPPTDHSEITPTDQLWWIEGDSIFLRDGAVLPAIELETGDDESDLLPVRRHVDVNQWASMLSVALIIVLILFLPDFGSFWIAPAIGGALGYGMNWIITKFFPSSRRRVQFHVFRNPISEKIQKRKLLLSYLGLIGWIWLISSGALVLYQQFDIFNGAATLAIGISGLVVFGLLIHRFRATIVFRAGQNETVQLQRVHPVAVTKLREISKNQIHGVIAG